MLSPEAVKYVKRRRNDQMANAPFKFDPPDWIKFFSQHGWQPQEISYLIEESIKLKRSFPISPLTKIMSLFMSKKVKDAFRKMSAYVILTPGN